MPTDRRWFSHEDQPRILVVGGGPAVGEPPGTELLVAPTDRPAPEWVLARLAERGIRSLLLEGGPTTNAAFLAAGAFDELYWTIGARLLASDALPMIAPIPGLTVRRAPARGAARERPSVRTMSSSCATASGPHGMSVDLGRLGAWGHLDSLPIDAARAYARASTSSATGRCGFRRPWAASHSRCSASLPARRARSCSDQHRGDLGP